MTGVQWSRLAIRDLMEIRRYVAEHDPRAARKLARKLLAAAAQLRRQPNSGRAGRVSGTRELVINGTPFVAAYRVRDDIVEILRVLHGARRWPNRLE